MNAKVAAGATLVYLLVLGRLAFVDVDIAFDNLFLNGHFLTFLTAAASFLLGAWWWRSSPRSAIRYFLGHLILMYALIAQLDGWASRHVAPGNYASAQSAIVSLVFAVYAIGFIGAGVATKTAFNRIAGLTLFGVIILKLYLYDVWLFQHIYRVIAFLVLGAMLVGGSYIYSRYSVRINALWRADDTPPA